jgi:hypothetical protein
MGVDYADEQQGFQRGLAIRSIAELIEALAHRYSSQNRVLWFRGQRKSSWDVSPGIWRGYILAQEAEFQATERNYTNRFRSRATIRHSSLPTYRNYGPWLSLMQHYGLPTRLLDWSRSPLVGLYFAVESLIYRSANANRRTESSSADDGALWVLDPLMLNLVEMGEEVTPAVEADMCREMLRPAFTNNAEENFKVCAAMSSENDARMFVQQGCFTIHSDRTPLNRKAESNRYLTRLTIPAENLKQIALEVDVCGLRRGDLFPDLAELAIEMTSRSVADLI